MVVNGKKCEITQTRVLLPIFHHQELTKRSIHGALREFILTIMGLKARKLI